MVSIIYFFRTTHYQEERRCRYCERIFFVCPSQKTKYCCHECKCNSQKTPILKSFWDRVVKTTTCWLWIGGKNYDGYGHFSRTNEVAHRFSWKIHNGPIPAGTFVLHKCDNPPCVNPGHLFLGTQKNNREDCCNKMRQAYGEKNYGAKLSEQDAINIIKDNRPRKEISAEYGVHVGTIKNIQLGRSWKYLHVRH